MKKLMLILLVAVMSIGIIACGKEEVNPNDGGNKENQETQNVGVSSETEESSNTGTENIKNDVQSLKAILADVYLDYEPELTTREEGYTVLVYNTNDALVGLTALTDDKYSGTLKDAVELFKTQFLYDASCVSKGALFGSSFEVTSSKEVTIAGRESVCFIATVSNRDKWDCHVYGYVFVIDEVPCAVIGLVSADTQDPAMIAEIDARVDRMAATIRTEE